MDFYFFLLRLQINNFPLTLNRRELLCNNNVVFFAGKGGYISILEVKSVTQSDFCFFGLSKILKQRIEVKCIIIISDLS